MFQHAAQFFYGVKQARFHGAFGYFEHLANFFNAKFLLIAQQKNISMRFIEAQQGFLQRMTKQIQINLNIGGGIGTALFNLIGL